MHGIVEARRAVKEAKASSDEDQLRVARAAVNEAKVALGERGRYGGATVVGTTIAIGQSTRPTLSGTARFQSLRDHTRRSRIYGAVTHRHCGGAYRRAKILPAPNSNAPTEAIASAITVVAILDNCLPGSELESAVYKIIAEP